MFKTLLKQSSLVALFALSAVAAESQKISISVLGTKKFEGTVDELKKIEAPKKITIQNPTAEKQTTYLALDFKALMKKLKAGDWSKSKALKITCTDGYTPVVLTSNLKSGQPYLAIEGADGTPFHFMAHGKDTPLGPLYLVWTQKMTAAQGKVHETGGNWPYQIVSLSFE